MNLRQIRWLITVLIGLPGLGWSETKVEGFLRMNSESYSETVDNEEKCCSQNNQSSFEASPKLLIWTDLGVDFHVQPYVSNQEEGENSYYYIKKASLAYNLGDQSFLAGIDEVYWGVTEFYQPGDFVNQYDIRFETGNEEKIGQSMFAYQYWMNWGSIQALLLPFHQSREYRAPDQRLGPPLEVDSEANYIDGEQLIDIAFRLESSWQSLDFSVKGFQGNSREPLLIRDNNQFRQYYYQTRKIGLDAQWTLTDLLLKTDVLYTEGFEDEYSSSIVGLEYSIYGFSFSQAQMDVFLEYGLDTRSNSEPSTSVDNDLMLGFRWQFNDVRSSEVFISGSYDTENSSRFYKLTATSRLSDQFSLSIVGYSFSGLKNEDSLAYLKNDSFIKASLSYYF